MPTNNSVIDVDAITKQTLALVASYPPKTNEELWMWLSDRWIDIFSIVQKTGVSVGKTEDVEVSVVPYTGDRQYGDLFEELASIVLSLNEHRDDPTQRVAILNDLEKVLKTLRVCLLESGNLIGWHPFTMSTASSVTLSGHRQKVMLHALRLRSLLKPRFILSCYRDVLEGPQGKDVAVYHKDTLAMIDMLEQVLKPWGDIFSEVLIPSKAVSRQLASLCQISKVELRHLLREVNRDIDCLVQGAFSWQNEKEISLLPMMFAVRRLHVDVNELREIVVSQVNLSRS